MSRQIILDTETTGLHPNQGERIIEICAMEMIERELTGRTFHEYLNPEGKKIHPLASKVHGVTDDMLTDKPIFEDIEGGLNDFIDGCEIVIHNAQFDVGFIDNELKMIGADWKIGGKIPTICTLRMARFLDGVKFKKGYKLDDLMEKYDIKIERELHGALVDVKILSEVYLHLTKPFYFGEWK